MYVHQQTDVCMYIYSLAYKWKIRILGCTKTITCGTLEFFFL